MKQIWAPWRRLYIEKKQRGSGCLFCRMCRAPRSRDAKNFLLLRSSHHFVVLNLYPYNNGHLLIVPNRHVSSLEKLGESERLDLLMVLDRTVRLLKKILRAQGFNIGINLGDVSGAGIVGHVHVHVVPRWKGDTNFMPVLGATKVISDSLRGVYGRLHGGLSKSRRS